MYDIKTTHNESFFHKHDIWHIRTLLEQDFFNFKVKSTIIEICCGTSDMRQMELIIM